MNTTHTGTLSAYEMLSVAYNRGLTQSEKMEAVTQLEARKKQQAGETVQGINPLMLSQAYGESTSRREEKEQAAELEAKMKRLADLEAKAQAAQEAHIQKQQQEARLERLAHLEQAEKAGLI
ncbi:MULTISPECIES: hypothetical protein [Bacillus]|uniref:Uncharacterized protein n=1 Tax=Bacillus toyonensis TaxID=155322 RepID=A0ABX6GFI1_9BACI|nr:MULTISPECIES: hypothetical protein [Bacillus cereus group]ANC10494.1 hypothetical protein WR47_26410 [Bacillus cereus]ANC16310.1 hypothetical protein WR51_26410 [Bacillus cereus]MDA1992698.1 hypothetical protein [Bacillus cereus]MDA1998599.1 hypothetical protein [Bacillus cereus]MDA3650456.1 hypothetical protein [Bacillus cereus]